MKKPRRRPGRPRNSTAARHASGRIVHHHGPVHTPELVERRAELVGVKNATNALAGTPLGILRLTGRISERQYQAGEKAGYAWQEWRSVEGIRPPHASALAYGDTRPPPVDWDAMTPDQRKVAAERRQRAIQAMNALRRAVMGVPQCALAFALVESICDEKVMPLRFTDTWLGKDWPEGIKALRDALDALAKLYRIPEAVDERQAA